MACDSFRVEGENRKAFVRGSVLSLAGVSFLALCLAQASESQETRQAAIDTLILQMHAEDFEQREAATRELRGLGRWVLPYVKAARDRAEDPEAEERLDAILLGPTIEGQRVVRWIAALQDGSGASGQRALGVLERAGASALPHALELLDPDNLPMQFNGLWLMAQLGPKGQAALPTLKKLLQAELELLGHVGPPQAWELEQERAVSEIYILPYSTRLGGPPAAVFYANRRDSPSADVAEILSWRFHGQAKREAGRFRLRSLERLSAEARESALWGGLQFMERCRSVKIACAEVSPAMYLGVLTYVLERIGPDEEAKAALAQAAQVLELLQREDEVEP